MVQLNSKISLENDMELVAGCIANDAHMQFQLYNKYKDAMYTLAFRVTSNPDEAKDALQDGFIEVFKNLHQFRGPYGLSKWIKVIILRSSIKYVKKHKVDMENLEEVDHQIPIIWPASLNGEILHRAINRLNGKYKAVFVLYEVEGYDHEEIAEMLDITAGNSKILLHRSKKTLRELLTALNFEK